MKNPKQGKMSLGGVDPVLYSKYHDLQERDVNDFILASASIFKWGNLTNKVIMDVGCGPGNTSSAWFMTLYPAIRRLVGVDISEGMIHLAKILNPHPKIEFMVADISDESTLECWERNFNKVISTWCFHFIKDQNAAFRNIYNLLRPGGEAAVLFEVSSPYHACYEHIIRSPKWNHLFKNLMDEYSELCVKNFEETYYKQLLQQLGFAVILCKRKPKNFTFQTDDDCIGYALAMFPGYKIVPGELMDEFRKDLFQSFMMYGGREPNGRPVIYYNMMNILVRKAP
ncbi:juvenile hormone acid O-methyltransferase [Caerostris darwini]|uniref:Juvenile hormone acid O-methyltransferase n=1 Tax=Caerostris darwini TaxID=1538125 RepID=A0AAV4SAZ6_9ARAC|nr:juvenile hormone acid O-methyltransferase [Caerostris darwini]